MYHDRGVQELPALIVKQPVNIHEMGKWEKGTSSGTCKEPRSYNRAMESGIHFAGIDSTSVRNTP